MALRRVVSTDRFPQERRPLPDDRSKHQRFRTITCSAKGCGKVGEVLDQTSTKNLPPEVVAKKFRQLGWHVGSKASQDLCPTHARPANRRAQELADAIDRRSLVAEPVEPPPQRKMRVDAKAGTASYKTDASAEQSARQFLRRWRGVDAPRKGRHYEVFTEGLAWGWRELPIRDEPENTLVPDPKEPPMSETENIVNLKPWVEPPRQPTREDNKRIRDELDASYDEPKQRYKGDWTDQRLAEALKVPRAWVTRLREELYGPERNEKDDAEKQEVIRLKGILTAFEAKLAKHVEEGMALIDEAAAIRSKIEALEGKWG